eukprot:TRINITY_DN1061_c0_g1_i1.p1 TRINITY_DN1061_c0_g1~~TRINITY_DN1061_c0_g1_i1.p1  ORF type:complete len:437 (+),score=148.20 TRINITY_DN1061_c0_g1_i1:48-1358(+)
MSFFISKIIGSELRNSLLNNSSTQIPTQEKSLIEPTKSSSSLLTETKSSGQLPVQVNFKRHIKVITNNITKTRRKLSFRAGVLLAIESAIKSVISAREEKNLEFFLRVDDVGQKLLSLIDLSALQQTNNLTISHISEPHTMAWPDYSVIYLLYPSEQSLANFFGDFTSESQLFKEFNLFSLSPIDPEFEEEIQNDPKAQKLVAQIRILDIDFFPYEDKIFHLDCPLEKYINYLTSGPEFTSNVPRLAHQIFSSLKLLDIHETATVRYIKNSQMATELGTELQRIIDQNTPENLIDSTEKQTVLIVDRNFDLGTLFAHDPSYESLIFDNKIFCPISRQPLKLELMPDDKPTFLKDEVDPLWKRYRHLPINQMIKLIGGDLTHWEKANEHIIKYENGEVKENLSTKELRDIAQQLPIYEKEKKTICYAFKTWFSFRKR